MYPIKDTITNQYGYWTGTAWAIPPQFFAAYPFSNGQALIKNESLGEGFLNGSGNVNWLRNFSVDETVGFYDFFNIPCSLSICRRIDSSVCLVDKELNVHDLASVEIHNAQYLAIVGNILLGRFKIDSDSFEYKLFDLRGERVMANLQILDARPSPDEGLWAIQIQDSWTFLNTNGWSIADIRVDDANGFSSGLGAVLMDGEWSVVNSQFQPQFGRKFQYIEQFSSGFAVAYTNDQCGYLNIHGRFTLLDQYDEIGAVNRFGIAIGNKDSCDWTLNLIHPNGEKIKGPFSAVDFMDGDYPYFDLWKDDVVELYSPVSGTVLQPPLHGKSQ